jgi:hypothetical protein
MGNRFTSDTFLINASDHQNGHGNFWRMPRFSEDDVNCDGAMICKGVFSMSYDSSDPECQKGES